MSLEELFVGDEANLIKGSYTVDEEAKKQYINASVMLTTLGLRQQYTIKLDNPEKPYSLHCVFIKWIDDDWPEVEAKPIADIIGKFDTIIVNGSEWQLNKVIYTKL